MDKNGQQIQIQRPKYTSKQIKNLYTPQKNCLLYSVIAVGLYLVIKKKRLEKRRRWTVSSLNQGVLPLASLICWITTLTNFSLLSVSHITTRKFFHFALHCMPVSAKIELKEFSLSGASATLRHYKKNFKP